MALPSLIDVLIVIILLVPGFLSVTIIRKITIMERKLSDYETTLWSVIASLIVYSIFGWFTGITNIDSIRDNIFSSSYLSFLLLIAVVLGCLVGLFIRFVILRDVKLIPGTCWDAAFQKMSEKGGYLIVYTHNGLEYKGKLHFSGKNETSKELVIREPKQILRDKEWKVIGEIEMGNELLFTEKDVQRVVFFKDLE